jgi:hypothetical protein
LGAEQPTANSQQPTANSQQPTAKIQKAKRQLASLAIPYAPSVRKPFRAISGKIPVKASFFRLTIGLLARGLIVLKYNF